MKTHLPPPSGFGRLTLLLCSCQAKTRVITWISHVHTPFSFQIPKTFTRFPHLGNHPSKAQHGQEVGRKQRTEISVLKPALDFYFFQAGAVLDYKSIWKWERKWGGTFRGQAQPLSRDMYLVAFDLLVHERICLVHSRVSGSKSFLSLWQTNHANVLLWNKITSVAS